MTCCNHSHDAADEAQGCETKKCCKIKFLLILVVVFGLGFLASRLLDSPKANAPAVTHEMAHSENAKKNAYTSAMNDMHASMVTLASTGDADIDFVKGMIPHHQGAIDMAKVLLRKGKDPEIKKLGEGIIAAQEGEIAMMRKWLEVAEAKFKAEHKEHKDGDDKK